ncbi:MAG: energy coupling factor transporter S component ThiW [Bacteroidales bacterium]|nr:energy coupling factor transporter S component ThiW [Fournierella massiliensis]MCF2556748.1 energy coupling factor transporter S component ThiW [Fournierella massiliensis]MCI6739729.1 energy coupling factor transporter S component ThiW [Bacteroidales bacterium]
MNHSQIKKLALCGLLCALGVVGSTFSIPVFASRCCPMQSIVNVVGAVLLGPGYAVGVGFVISLLRNLMGLGTLFAFPGSIFGALMAGLFYRQCKKLWAACLGECFGTGILATISAWPIATLIMGQECAMFTYLVPFLTTAVCGSIIGGVFLFALERTGALKEMRSISEK